MRAQPSSRGTAINRAWVQEHDLVKAGGGARNWTPQERVNIKFQNAIKIIM
ncbi:hypothetical protein [Entomomonas sp. E2T0]|uniref:hypothetical protein n=1 Tax=Entomomonas sp. E2T0 TaxID=2930213 RepID=UPI0039B6FF99